MDMFNQNRAVIKYDDETVMLEYSEEIDPKIQAEFRLLKITANTKFY